MNKSWNILQMHWICSEADNSINAGTQLLILEFEPRI